MKVSIFAGKKYSGENEHICVVNQVNDVHFWQSHKWKVSNRNELWGVRIKRDGEQRTKGMGGQRWVDNQSTESSFHTYKFKADGVCACCGGKREREGKRSLISFGSPRLHLTPSIKKGREAWSVHCHKINTDTKSKETEIKRVMDVERAKV